MKKKAHLEKQITRLWTGNKQLFEVGLEIYKQGKSLQKEALKMSVFHHMSYLSKYLTFLSTDLVPKLFL